MASFYKRLKNDAWAIKTEKEKRELLQEFENENAKKSKRKARGIRFENIAGLKGLFDNKADVIVISESILHDAGEALYVTAHEGRHAYQWDVVSGKIKNDNHTNWVKNWNGYLNPNNLGIEYCDYYLQAIELDANVDALKKMRKISKKVKDGKISKRYQKQKKFFNDTLADAELEYGRKYEKIIQAKIDNAFSSNNAKNSFSDVHEILSREGIKVNKIFSDYITPSLVIEKQAPLENKTVGNDKTKEEKMLEEFTKATEKKQQSLAKKYGVAPEVVDKLINKVEAPKTPSKPTQEAEEHKENTQKITTKKGNEKIQVTIEKSKG